MALFTEETEEINSSNAAFVEALYADYLADPNSVSHDWQRFFSNIAAHEWPQPQIGPSFKPSSVFNPPSAAVAANGANGHATNGSATNGHANGAATKHGMDMAVFQDRVDQLIRAYRVR